MSSHNSQISNPTSNGLRKLAFLVLGLAIFAGLIYYGGFDSLKKITTPNPYWLASAMLGTGIMLFIYSTRWAVIAKSLSSKAPSAKGSYFLYSLSSLAIGNIIPHAASVIMGRAAALYKFHNISLQKSTASVLIDKVFDGFFMIIFTWPLLLLLSGYASVNQVAGICLFEFCIITPLIFLNYKAWLSILCRLISFSARIVSGFPLIGRLDRLKDLQELSQLQELQVLQKDTVLRAYLLSAIGQVMMALRAWLAAQVVGLEIGPLETFIAIGLSRLPKFAKSVGLQRVICW